jgi:hypothetical protein
MPEVARRITQIARSRPGEPSHLVGPGGGGSTLENTARRDGAAIPSEEA